MKRFINLKLQSKLLLGFFIIGVISAVIGIIGISRIKTVAAQDTLMYNNMLVPVYDLQQITYSFQRIRVLARDMIITDDQAVLNNHSKEIEAEKNNIVKHSDNFRKTLLTERGKVAYVNFRQSYEAYLPLLDQVVYYSRAGRDKEASSLLYGEMGTAAQRAGKAFDELVSIKVRVAGDTARDNTAIASNATIMMIALILLGMLCSAALAVYIAKYISGGITRVVERFQSLEKVCLKNLEEGSGHLAEGFLDFTIRTGTEPLEVTSKDEIGVLSENLNVIIARVQSTVSSVENAVAKVREVIAESNRLVDAALHGRLSERGNAENFHGGYRELVEGLNKTFAAAAAPINDSGKLLGILASGNLTVRMTGEYNGEYARLKENINSLAESFSSALSEVDEAIQATASAATEISSSSEQMAAGSQEQSQQTTEIAGAVEQMTKTILDSNKNTNYAAENSRLASLNASTGAVKIAETKEGMKKIVESTKQTGDRITSLANRTGQIGEITQVINDIADQTNLLALNAAIEAARAGEQGRGFAVVADEVRKLAERTTKATKEIGDTIEQIQQEARLADESMENAGRAVDEGMRLTEEVAGALDQILNVNQKVNDIITQVAAASEEQSIVAEQISRNIEGISSVTQQSAAGTEQIARAAEDLNRLTVNLQSLMGRFELQKRERHNHEAQHQIAGGQIAARMRNKLMVN